MFVAVATGVNLLIGTQLTETATAYMNSVQFCGEACHTVMAPQFRAHQAGPHSNVACVDCHNGAGFRAYVHSQRRQFDRLISLASNRYPRPITAPAGSLPQASEVCVRCHAVGNARRVRLRIVSNYADDEDNTPTHTVLVMRVAEIHGAHMAAGMRMRFAATDSGNQNIAWVEVSRPGQPTDLYRGPATDDGKFVREMQCTECHNRAAHAFFPPEAEVNRAIAAGQIAPGLPFAKKKAVELLRAAYPAGQEPARIADAFRAFYRKNYAGVAMRQPAAIEKAAAALREIWSRNIFPEMRVNWGTYPNLLGHTESLGCFRCHDEQHITASGKCISQDCGACHSLAAMDDPAPRALFYLGLAPGK